MPTQEELVAWMEAARWRHFAVEFAGAFWVAAEYGILCLVIMGRYHLEHCPESRTLSVPPRLRLLLMGFLLKPALIFVAVVLRFFFRARAQGELLSIEYAIGQETLHLLIWSCFVTGWVVLEIAIVYQGWRVFNALQKLLLPTNFSIAPRPLVGLLLLSTALLSANVAAAELTGLHAALVPAQNMLYFYLRVAGVVWIAVEWVAAYLLVRSVLLLRVRTP